jgi:hypothetical protein
MTVADEPLKESAEMEGRRKAKRKNFGLRVSTGNPRIYTHTTVATGRNVKPVHTSDIFRTRSHKHRT